MTPDNPQVVAVRDTPASHIVIQPQSTMFGRFGKLMLLVLVLMGIALITGYNKYRSYFSPPDGPQEKYHSLSKESTKKIAIISIDGTILKGEDSFEKKQIDRVRDDKDVVAVVLRINTPGGSVSASDYLYHHLRKLAEGRKSADRELPIVVSMGGLCASGGYYLAMAVGEKENVIFAEPTTWTGSIGVMIPHYDLSGSLSALKAKDDSLSSGPHKLMGSPTRPMNEEDRKLFQELVDDSFQEFKAIVASGRKKFKDDPDALNAVTTGQIFTAKQALANGLVDRIGFIEDAIDRAAELARVSPENVRCVEYNRPPSIFGEVFSVSAAAQSEGGVDLEAMLSLMTPRAYYLWSWLPAAMTNER